MSTGSTKTRICLADCRVRDYMDNFHIRLISENLLLYRYLLQSPVPVNKLSHLSLGPEFSARQVSVRKQKAASHRPQAVFLLILPGSLKLYVY